MPSARGKHWGWNIVYVTGVVGTIAWSAFSAPAMGQTANLEVLLERMDRMERDIRAMSRNLYRGDAVVPQGQGFAQPGAAGDLELRVQELERQVRTLTRVVSDQNQVIARLERRLSGERVPAVEQPVRGSEAVPPPLPPARQVAGAPGQPPSNGTGPGRTTQTLGQVQVEEVQKVEERGQQAVAAAKATAPSGEPEPGETPEILFDRSRQLLLRQDSVAAETGFNRFLNLYPDHELASEARFWLGETYYVRQDYATAAKIFLESFKRDPKGGKAPNALLKLGMSLSALGSTKEACTTYRKLLQDFPRMRANMQNIAKREQERIGCR